MIFDIFTILFFVFGFVLILRMIGEWRRDVLHGPYVTREVPANDAGGTKTFTAPWSTLLEVSRAARSITRVSLISASSLSPRLVALGGRYIVASERALKLPTWRPRSVFELLAVTHSGAAFVTSCRNSAANQSSNVLVRSIPCS
jgi:hypothetical protein